MRWLTFRHARLRGEGSIPGFLPPPSSLRKPLVSRATPDTAYQLGFPATRFPDFGLCRRSRILVMIFAVLSLHPKIPFPAARLSARSDRTNTGNSAFLGPAVIRD